ncbi:acylphosphatase [Neptunomonas japonica]|uniref:Acylphosphatase n=1 Tax=Neptunomonas japonica JAMM 1380 TaxID=1441457 RepID=A0A7R6PGT9_9GAMM|nr:acylphosphatase [Neptunomonas japonica]BBB29947.1 acylphosphatase [Neptunomonas japonica JAMM 1380]
MAKICISAFVAGKVQGVWFRKSTMDEALSYGLTGWVRNLSDGRVQVMLCGESNAVRQVEAWLQIGPALANVAQVISESLPYDESFNGFVMRGDEREC